MPFTHNIVRTYQEGGRTTTNTVSLEGDGESAFSVSVPVASPDTEVRVGIRYAGLQAIYIASDRDLTVETNSGSAPDDTIEVKADVSYIWTDEDGSRPEVPTEAGP